MSPRLKRFFLSASVILGGILLWAILYKAHQKRLLNEWNHEFDQAQIIAKRDRKDLLIVFGGSDWCWPCLDLKTKVLSKLSFIRKAKKPFVLVDIDDLKRTPMPPGRADRYKALEKHYNIEFFPSVILATPDGLPYAFTSYLESTCTPDAYWKHLEQAYLRGKTLQTAFEHSEKLEGLSKAKVIVDGLSSVPNQFVQPFYRPEVEKLRNLDPADHTGYLAFLDGWNTVTMLQKRMLEKDASAVSIVELNNIVLSQKVSGESLQQIYILQALVHMNSGRIPEAISSYGPILAAQKTRTRFDVGDMLPLNETSAKVLEKNLSIAHASGKTRLEQLKSLHRIIVDLPIASQVSCGHGFCARYIARGILGEAYGRLLIESTIKLKGKERAKALGAGLEGTDFTRNGAIGEILDKILPTLVPHGTITEYLPKPYSEWVR